ncbi:MAG: hypothetical protein WA989_18455 [Henriciella sp.]|uniref:hypothetical protein n=1 Tax=Henriciella sp. TaxID=1968823 RepID=UPI003C723B60
MTDAKRVRIPCTIRISHTWESLEAHVELPGNSQPEMGDRVTVHGAPVQVPFGETITIQREATIRRANPLEKLWIRIRSMFELDELYEVNFTTEILR